jgi:hypothetical protein
MRERLHLDVYNVIIVALVPVILLTAWGLTTAYETNQRREHCAQAITWLEEATEISSLYTTADSLDDAETWSESLQELSRPAPANDLHEGALSTYSYAESINMNVNLQQPGALYDASPAFQDVLDEGRETLVSQCPDTEPLIADAFPMYFADQADQNENEDQE